MASPLTKTSPPTAGVFVAFMASSIVPVEVFGLFMAIGVLFSALWSLTAMPAALALVPARRLRRAAPSATGGVTSWRMEALARWIVRRRAPIAWSIVPLL